MPLDPATASLAVGALSTGGGLLANSANARESRLNRRFQERMSSTAAQRAVKDYQAAGLNPALAYDRTASSPGGAQANLSDPVEKGVSSAMAAKQMFANLELTRAQTKKFDAEGDSARAEANLKNGVGALSGTDYVVQGEPTWREEKIAERRARIRNLDFEGTVQPYQRRQAAAEALLAEYLLPSARNDARMSERFGLWRTGLTDLTTGARALDLLRSALRR